MEIYIRLLISSLLFFSALSEHHIFSVEQSQSTSEDFAVNVCIYEYGRSRVRLFCWLVLPAILTVCCCNACVVLHSAMHRVLSADFQVVIKQCSCQGQGHMCRSQSSRGSNTAGLWERHTVAVWWIQENHSCFQHQFGGWKRRTTAWSCRQPSVSFWSTLVLFRLSRVPHITCHVLSILFQKPSKLCWHPSGVLVFVSSAKGEIMVIDCLMK